MNIQKFLSRTTLVSICVAAVFSMNVSAQENAGAKDEKSSTKKDAFGDLFGDSLKSKKADDLKALSGKVKSQGKNKGLDLREAPKNESSPITIVDAFAAERIRLDKKKGCHPGGRTKVKVTKMNLYFVPGLGPKVSVCVTLKGGLRRPARLNLSIVDTRNKKVGDAVSIVDFLGRPQVDHVMEFPALRYEIPGQYFYRVEVDGERVGDFKLFEVVKDGDDD